ncbi:hypothetical protein VR010_15040 [Actinomycetaceae bacterium L2_0104]
MTQIPEEAIEKNPIGLVGDHVKVIIKNHTTINLTPMVEEIIDTVRPAIEKQIRAQVAADIRRKKDQIDPKTYGRLPADHHEIGRVAAYERAARIAEGGPNA